MSFWDLLDLLSPGDERERERRYQAEKKKRRRDEKRKKKKRRELARFKSRQKLM